MENRAQSKNGKKINKTWAINYGQKLARIWAKTRETFSKFADSSSLPRMPAKTHCKAECEHAIRCAIHFKA